MAKNTSVALGDHFSSFIQKQMETGKYSSVSEVLRAGLRLLEQEDYHLRTLRDALIAGEQSGSVKLLDPQEFKKKLHKKHLKPDV